MKWYNALKRINDVVERGLTFRETSHRIGDQSNGNLLGLIEPLSRWDPMLQEHVPDFKDYQEKGESL